MEPNEVVQRWDTVMGMLSRLDERSLGVADSLHEIKSEVSGLRSDMNKNALETDSRLTAIETREAERMKRTVTIGSAAGGCAAFLVAVLEAAAKHLP